jgi:hypothetical protein
MPETPEAVAFVLLEKIWKEENWDRQSPDGTRTPIHRRTILDTYAECLAVVRGETNQEGGQRGEGRDPSRSRLGVSAI